MSWHGTWTQVPWLQNQLLTLGSRASHPPEVLGWTEINSVPCGHELFLPEVQLGVRRQLPDWFQVVRKWPPFWPLTIFIFTIPPADSTHKCHLQPYALRLCLCQHVKTIANSLNMVEAPLSPSQLLALPGRKRKPGLPCGQPLPGSPQTSFFSHNGDSDVTLWDAYKKQGRPLGQKVSL